LLLLKNFQWLECYGGDFVIFRPKKQEILNLNNFSNSKLNKKILTQMFNENWILDSSWSTCTNWIGQENLTQPQN
jgi:hypothetical protein